MPPIETIEVNLPIGPVEVLELPVSYIDRDMEAPGTVRISLDPLNIIERRGDGLYAAPQLASAQW